jgi:hypothetical protein
MPLTKSMSTLRLPVHLQVSLVSIRPDVPCKVNRARDPVHESPASSLISQKEKFEGKKKFKRKFIVILYA